MRKILIIDDDAELRGNLSEILTGARYHPEEAASGKEALEKAASGDFDIALLDLMMPGMSGTETLAELRRISPKTKVIMITAFATVNNAVDAIKSGASDYISKPFKIEELLMTIKRVIEEARFEAQGTKLEIDYTLSSLANPIRRNILRLLCSRNTMRLMEITKELDIEDHTKVVFHLKMLKESGIIEQDRERSYRLTEEGQKTLNCLKILENYLSE
jgi:DNA-binding response OmpR family regulator